MVLCERTGFFGLLVDLSALFAERWQTLVHIKIPSDDELSRVAQADLSLQHVGCGMESPVVSTTGRSPAASTLGHQEIHA